jgi:hypothetical protein
MKEDIQLTANSNQLCKCEQSNLNITEINEGNVLLEKFCPACGATTIIYKEMPVKEEKEHTPYGAAHFMYPDNDGKNFSGTVENESDLKGLKEYCHYQYEHGESFYLLVSTVKDGKHEIDRKDYTQKKRDTTKK